MILWDLTRSSAFVALGCYTLTVSWGILLAGRALRPAAPQLVLHRFLASVGLAALLTHVATLLLDRFAHIGPAALIGIGVPKLAVLPGVAALWLALALPLSIRLRRMGAISQRLWRTFHYAGYAVWALALAHGLTAGSDTGSPWARLTYAASAALVAAAACRRWLEPAVPAPPAREEAP